MPPGVRGGRGRHANEVNNPVCYAEGTRRLYTPTQFRNLGPKLRGIEASTVPIGPGVLLAVMFEGGKELVREVDKARAYVLADQVLGG